MFVYEKKLEYPIRIKNSNPALAKFICSQYGGPDGELGASLRYLSQRYAMPYPELSAILTDIGTEELGHLEMVGTIVYQLTRSMTPEQIKQSGYDTYFVDHTAGVFPQFASGTPWTAATIGVTGDVIADLSEDMSAEQKARKTYDNILRLCDDPDVTDVIRFLREREVVHYQRFGRMHKERRGAGAGKRRGNLLADMTGFTDARHDHFAFAVDNRVGGADKILAQTFWQAAGFLQLQHQRLAARF